ncbi:putative ubiquitin-protein ligase [Naematelia encephala]|uniref:Putative ubiquitin-protein ligase n=1 Tax=Naematelia encephala TaxID=71784 RepID=A0A1Y2BBY0_9TREE|nr:putative ubiquitin-protein ligase [Naematelia encephala]
MTTLLPLPVETEAFSEYRPSKAAHSDFLISGDRRREAVGALSSGPRVIKLSLKPRVIGASASTDLSTVVDSIAPILSGNQTSRSFHHISAALHRLVLPPHNEGETIYTRLRQELERSVAALAREWRGAILGRETGWLDRLVQGWKTWQGRVNLLASVYVYLDRVYCNEASGISSIRDVAIDVFRKGIWENELLFGKTRDDVLAWVTSERETSTVNEPLRKTVSDLAALARLLGTYDTLATPYLDLTISHYDDASAAHLAKLVDGTMSATRYVEWVLERVEEERDRARECLGPDGQVAETVVGIVRREAGEKRSSEVVRHATDEAMDISDAKALESLNTFAVDVGVFPMFVKALQAHIEDRLKKLISDPANDSQMIESTLTLKRFADKAVAGLFVTPTAAAPSTVLVGPAYPGVAEPKLTSDEEARKMELEDAIRQGFKAGMGSRQNAPAEWIAKHLDVVMRRGQGSGTEAEFNQLLDEIVALIGFTKDKDVFKAFYSTQLAKRLLLNKSASDDMERNMILKLQREMGEEFTSGDIMMKDLQLSETLVKAYQSAQAKNPDQFVDAGNFAANVLTESAWPAYPLLKDGWNFKLTPDLQASIDAFTSWYATQHKNRQLSWRWQLATVTLSGRFASGKYEIGVSLFQAVVMMQFNEEDVLTFKDIKERTGIESSELVRTLQSLALGRKGTRVLLKKPPGKEVNPTDVFAYNKGFTSERIKFRINQIQQDLSAEESRATNEQVAIDRVSVLEATIVRIMKARKKMTLQLLIDQVVTDVSKRFPPDVKEIKKRMESLIEREFLMRDEDDRNLLHYLA